MCNGKEIRLPEKLILIPMLILRTFSSSDVWSYFSLGVHNSDDADDSFTEGSEESSSLPERLNSLNLKVNLSTQSPSPSQQSIPPSKDSATAE